MNESEYEHKVNVKIILCKNAKVRDMTSLDLGRHSIKIIGKT